MDNNTNEQAVRAEAIRRRMQGERRIDICRALDRSPGWFSKWWRLYQADPEAELADRSRAPQTRPAQLAAPVVQAILTARQVLEAAQTPETRYGLIGHRAVQGRLRDLGVQPLPSLASIQRVLRAGGLTHPLGAGQASAYYPWPIPWGVNAIQATDIITRYVHGGETLENFHTLDLYSYAAALSQHADATSATARQHLLKAWAFLGLPAVQQLDNEGTFSGGHTHPRVIGQVCASACSAASSPSSPPSTKPSATTKSRTSPWCGWPAFGSAVPLPAWPKCRPKPGCLAAGIISATGRQRWTG